MPSGITSLELVLQAMQEARDGEHQKAVELARQAIRTDFASIKQHKAHILMLGADWQTIGHLLPANTNSLVTSGWLLSLINDYPINAQGKPIPWFTYPAIDFLEQHVKSDWSVLEWGCGNSTLWWSERVKRVVSLEHNRNWHEIISRGAPQNASIVLSEDRDRYVNLQDVANQDPFDVIVIDGEERNACARHAVLRAKPSTIIVFDNSDRKTSRDGVLFLTTNGWNRIDFFGLIPSNLYRTCTSIFYRDDAFMRGGPLPSDFQSSLGPSLSQAMNE